MRHLLALAALLAAPGAAPKDPVPSHVRATEARRPVDSDPAREPARWLLAFVDVETTGLVPGYHEMIDAGFVVTDLEGEVQDTLFLRVQPEHPERLSPGAQRVNGFDGRRWRELGALSPRAAAERIAAFHRGTAGDKHVLLVAFNCSFDTAFLDHLFRGAGRSWRELFHYFVLDLPSMAWSLGLRDLTNGALAARLGVPDEPRVAVEHTGLTGAQLNVRLYRALRARGAGLTSLPAAAASGAAPGSSPRR